MIGLGNTYRRDDGLGVAVATELEALALPNVRVVTGIADPANLLEAWSGATLAVVIDAAVTAVPVPGRVRRCTLDEVVGAGEGLSSHSIDSHTVDIRGAHALGQALSRVPEALVVFTVEVADTGHGVGLTPPVALAVPEVVRMAVDEINRTRTVIGG